MHFQRLHGEVSPLLFSPRTRSSPPYLPADEFADAIHWLQAVELRLIVNVVRLRIPDDYHYRQVKSKNVCVNLAL
jgi:hypothetical protein